VKASPAPVVSTTSIAGGATRTTSPPMLLGRKLLKKLATRQDTVSCHVEAWTSWVTSSRRHRHPLTMSRAVCTSSASPTHAGSTWRSRASTALMSV